MTDPTLPREPMSRLSQPEPARQRCPEYRDGWTSGAKPFLYGLAAVAVIVFIGWYVAAGVYRSQHCIYILGHWVEMSRTVNPLFCQ